MSKKKMDFKVDMVEIDSITPSPENDELYNRVDEAKNDFKELVDSIRKEGIKEPLQVTEDGFILSGHRRYAAAKKALLALVPKEPVQTESE